MENKTLLIMAVFLFAVSVPGYAGEQTVLFKEVFTSLDNWTPFFFPKIKKHSLYAVEKQGDEWCLKAQSSASASALIHTQMFNVYEYPLLQWRWKVENVYKKGDAGKKSGDDYPLRVYVMFRYRPAKAPFFDRLKYASAKLLYGSYPPQSTLNYIWANRQHVRDIITNSYSDRSKMIVLQTGDRKAGVWQAESVHIIEDYRRAFRCDPPPEACIAVMNDADNTLEQSVSYIDDITVYRKSE